MLKLSYRYNLQNLGRTRVMKANRLKLVILAMSSVGVLNIIWISKSEADMPVTTGKSVPQLIGKKKSVIDLKEISKNLSDKYTNSLNILAAIPKSELSKSTQAQMQVEKKEIPSLSPSAGGFQLASKLPGVVVLGSNTNSGAGSSSLNINGFSVGTVPGDTDGNYNSVAVTFDGVPINNPLSGDGGFYSSAMSISDILSSVNVINGPGNPSTRWQDSIGGTLNFIPIAPSSYASAKTNVSFGSFGAQTEAASVQTGIHDGWAVALAGGRTTARTPGLKYDYPSNAYAIYINAVHFAGKNQYSFGGYYTHAKYLAVPSVPLTPLGGYTTNGYNVPGPLLDEQANFYNTETPAQSYFDYTDNLLLLYAKQKIKLTNHSSFKNKMWFRRSHRVHVAHATYNGQSSHTLDEYYNPVTFSLGDRAEYTVQLNGNNIKIGAYAYYLNYHNPFILWNTPVYHQSVYHPYYDSDNETAELTENGYIEDHIHLFNKKLQIVPGISYSAYQITVSNLFPPTGSSDAEGTINGTFDPGWYLTYGGVEPSLGVNYRLLQHIHLYGNISYTNSAPGNEALGNEDGSYLDAKKIKLTHDLAYELGLRYSSKKIFMDAYYFHNHVSNIVNGLYAAGTNFAPTGYALGDATYQGVDFQLKYNPLNYLSIYASANIQRPYYTNLATSSGGNYAGNLVSGVPLHSFIAGITYHKLIYGGVFEANTEDDYVGSAAIPNPATGDDTLRSSGYNIVNFSTSYKTPMLDHFIPYLGYMKFKFNIFNLLNRHYNEEESVGSGVAEPGVPSSSVFGIQGAPITFYGSVSLKFA